MRLRRKKSSGLKFGEVWRGKGAWSPAYVMVLSSGEDWFNHDTFIVLSDTTTSSVGKIGDSRIRDRPDTWERVE